LIGVIYRKIILISALINSVFNQLAFRHRLQASSGFAELFLSGTKKGAPSQAGDTFFVFFAEG
jgi:hypothetical protein